MARKTIPIKSNNSEVITTELGDDRKTTTFMTATILLLHLVFLILALTCF